MDYIRFAISNPVKVTVGVLLVLLFGLIALIAIPVQLTPNVDKPIITIETEWTGRSPEEVEREVIEEQEDKLKGVSNLKEMTSTSSQGRGGITLEFYIGTDMSRALQEVSDKLREVPEYPDDVEQPVITAAESAVENPIAWMILTSHDDEFDIQTIHDDVDKRVKPYLERIGGISQVNIYGGREREVHIQIDPRRLAGRGITYQALRNALRMENVNISAGELSEGRLDVRIRTVGQYDRLEQVRQTIVTYTDGGPVRVGDLGDVVLTYEKRRSFVHSRGKPALAINAIRETGSNVVQVMQQLRQRIGEINRDILPQLGPKLTLTQVYDETIYIHEAIDLVLANLWQGGLLAIGVLALFLRKLRPTLIISLAIPICVIGSFLVMVMLGRNLNVVSLAGLAFAVGIVLDNAIVVLENIDRHLAMGKKPRQAAYDGTNEVWGAILASTLTTLVVFLPVIFMEEEAGQLFRDISLAVCTAVGLSLIVAVTVMPSASAGWLRSHDPVQGRWAGLYGFTARMSRFSQRWADFVHWGTQHRTARWAMIGTVTIGSILGAYCLMPHTTYLPKGNQNLVFGIMLMPPGYNIQQNAAIAQRLETRLEPYWQASSSQDLIGLPTVIHPFTQQPVTGIPPVDNFFFVSFSGQVFYGASSRQKDNVAPLEGLLQWAGSAVPGVIPLAFQKNLFGRGLGGANSIDVQVIGNDMQQIRQSASALQAKLRHQYGYTGVRPSPQNFDLPGPERQIRIDRVRAADVGVNVNDLGVAVQSLVDGLKVGDYRYHGDSIDLMLVRPPSMPMMPEQLLSVPLSVGVGDAQTTVPLSAVANLTDAASPQQIQRIEQRRAITLKVIASNDQPLEQVTNEIAAMVEPLRADGQIAPSIDVHLGGTADKLVQVREALIGRWHGWSIRSVYSLMTSRIFLAMLVNYLLMCALFESFLYPLVIMFTVPLAAVGGFLGLRLTHTFVPTQLLDVVTMLGFVILIGTVVNNAILVVAQAINFMKGSGESEQDRVQPMIPLEAIKKSVQTRLRPVMMTTLTTLFGLLPLVIKSGSGSEIYRGLGSVLLGGLVVATLFTLVVVPLVFSLTLDIKANFYRKWGSPMAYRTDNT